MAEEFIYCDCDRQGQESDREEWRCSDINIKNESYKNGNSDRDIDNCGGSDIDIVKDRNSENDSESDSVSERDNDGDF